jgi:arsenite-transporting ATPase
MLTTMFKNLPKFVFFTGKGGVGKTSLASATALSLAEEGRTVLLVSTDPASNVGQVFQTEIGSRITAIPQITGFDAIEINPEKAAAQYRERIVGPMRGVLPDKALKGIEEQLSGACTTEIAAFDEFTCPPHRSRSDRSLWPRHFRHGAHRTYHPASQAAGRLVGLSGGG